MKIRFDWKFWLGIAISLAGVLISLWIYRSDLSSYSFQFKKISQTSLQPPDLAKGLDLQMSIGGEILSMPYLTVFELVNDGAKPVSSSDFESAIEISSANKAVIRRTSISNVIPKDLTPTITVDEGIMKIQPMLFNPGDSIIIAVLTTGEKPIFSSRARIAGIKSISLIDTQAEQKMSIRHGVILLTMSLIGFVATGLVIGGWPSKGVALRPRSAFLVSIVASTAAGLAMIFGLEAFGIDGFWTVVLACFIAMVVTSSISHWVNRPVVSFTNV